MTGPVSDPDSNPVPSHRLPQGIALIAAAMPHHPVIAELHRQSFDEAWSEATIRSVLAMPGAFGLLAVGAGSGGENLDVSSPEPDLFGFALCRVVADECELLSLAVAKSARGRGIGGGLVDVVIDQLRRMQAEDTLITKLFLEVAEDNIEAQRLYKKRGFGPIGRRPGYYHRDNGPAMAALTFAANLSD
ncbi:MAG: GNAT family N-acetyltransferase [Rhodospirillales bacterium]|jgi:ribosomal-protein-alanine N-acetyltransferase|nr:GNAT family N-acetyltransferase [Rhodospirillales bacterium]MBT4005559.1 GNAT family N-acetyltransferase [Rhodospirillales bacterium]MBT5076307.1 GNAT family N-acetyltransferase [Rhodospirillales bacterium]MBT5112278.1 GNAT family N-acetyltransferase [Rhodospirillales bacterium]MBT5671979.1 GNAT family N-acetyltransferase [Rhodospirillales bacterium]